MKSIGNGRRLIGLHIELNFGGMAEVRRRKTSALGCRFLKNPIGIVDTVFVVFLCSSWGSQVVFGFMDLLSFKYEYCL